MQLMSLLSVDTASLISVVYFVRYNLYIDCMPIDGVQTVTRDMVDRMINVARSSPQLVRPG